MCGIAGIVAKDTLTHDERATVLRMRDTLAHRGPDAASRYFDMHAGLAHQRLAVIDLEAGHQPTPNENGDVWVIFNGEIYNHAELREMLVARGHRITSRCDTDVLPHLYEEFGAEMFTHLSGMFAIAVWDVRQRRLLLARDRIGVKPLYYTHDDRRIAFASELKALLEIPGLDRSIAPTAMMDYFALGYIPSPDTIYQSCRKLEPGQLLDYRNGRVTLRSYWHLTTTPESLSEQEWSDRIWQSVKAATQTRLVADVPVGAFLSGGLDSTAVCLAAAEALERSGQALTTFTVGFDDDKCDERGAAREVADLLGTNHIEQLQPADVATMLPRLAWHFDEPFSDPSAAPFFSICRLARQHATVMLSGDGGDEALAGYRRYRFDVAEERIRTLTPAAVRSPLFRAAAWLYPNSAHLPQYLRAARTLENIADDGATAHARSVSRMSASAARRLLHPDIQGFVRDYDPLERLRSHYNAHSGAGHLTRCQLVDIRFGLGDGILTKVDRASMAHGLEVRSPMLDYQFIQLALSMPESLRRHGAHGKLPLRHAVGTKLGDSIASRAKRGFATPLSRWFPTKPARASGENNNTLWSWIPGATRAIPADQQGLFSATELESRRVEHSTRAGDHGALFWSVATMNAWHRHFAATTVNRSRIDDSMHRARPLSESSPNARHHRRIGESQATTEHARELAPGAAK